MSRSGQKEYWNDHIESWDASAYGRAGSLPLLERLATPLRGHLKDRRDYAIGVVLHTAPRAILELGCGTGELLAGLPAELALERYVGVDVSRVAIEKARSRRYAVALASEPEFLVSSIGELDSAPYRGFDLVLGLGLTPYLKDDELEKLVTLVGDRPFLFDYHASGASLQNLLHWIYRRLVNFPFYRLFDADEIGSVIRQAGIADFEVVEHKRLSFVQRLPAGG
jgi:SAM-dependent methyltransferase